jgi:hypothetical protein
MNAMCGYVSIDSFFHCFIRFRQLLNYNSLIVAHSSPPLKSNVDFPLGKSGSESSFQSCRFWQRIGRGQAKERAKQDDKHLFLFCLNQTITFSSHLDFRADKQSSGAHVSSSSKRKDLRFLLFPTSRIEHKRIFEIFRIGLVKSRKRINC